MARGWSAAAPHDDLVLAPMSDGGPGFLDVLGDALGGQTLAATVEDPTGRAVPAGVLLVDERRDPDRLRRGRAGVRAGPGRRGPPRPGAYLVLRCGPAAPPGPLHANRAASSWASPAPRCTTPGRGCSRRSVRGSATSSARGGLALQQATTGDLPGLTRSSIGSGPSSWSWRRRRRCRCWASRGRAPSRPRAAAPARNRRRRSRRPSASGWMSSRGCSPTARPAREAAPGASTRSPGPAPRAASATRCSCSGPAEQTGPSTSPSRSVYPRSSPARTSSSRGRAPTTGGVCATPRRRRCPSWPWPPAYPPSPWPDRCASVAGRP